MIARKDSPGAAAALMAGSAMYRWPDGTEVAAELVDNVACLADVLNIANIRERQRTHPTQEADK